MEWNGMKSSQVIASELLASITDTHKVLIYNKSTNISFRLKQTLHAFTFFTNSQMELTLSISAYSNRNCPRFTSTASSFSKLITGNKPPIAYTPLSLTPPFSSLRKRHSQALPIHRIFQRSLIGIQQASHHISGLAAFSVRLSVALSVPFPSSCHIYSSATPPFRTESPASLAVSHAVLLLLGAAVALRGPADLHKSLRQQVDFEVVPTTHHADGAQLDTGKCRVGYKGKKERNGVPEMIPSS